VELVIAAGPVTGAAWATGAGRETAPAPANVRPSVLQRDLRAAGTRSAA
jgi:hypothetical protein